jgi:L-alanine-DL-glutamate epimerase-like enolase superfamily enzyme
MKITKIETIRVKEFGAVVWVQVHTDEGLVGLGETWFGARGVSALIHDVFSPMLIGRSPLDIELHWKNMFRMANAFGFAGAEARAISALDMALWDIAGQATNQPIYNLLGGACRDRIRVYNTCAGYGEIRDNTRVFNDPDGLAESLLSDGITAMKASFADFLADSGAAFGYDIHPRDIEKALEPLRKIRKAVGDAIEIANDGHGRFSLHNSIKLAQAMEPYNLLWQEELLEPVNVETHLRLAQETKTPICVSERLISRYQFKDYIESGAAEIVMPDLIWTGGISETKRICAMAEAYQTPVCPHDCTGPVNVFACAHICMNAPNAMLMETVRAFYHGWYERFIEPNLRVEKGYLLAPEGPGIGTRLRPEVRKRPDVSIEASDTPGHIEWGAFRAPNRPQGWPAPTY